MRRIFILRHAKSDWPANVADDKRPLTENGHHAARAIAEAMQENGYRPDLVLCSPAQRTRQTFAPIKSIWPDINVEYRDRLYLASTGQLYEELKSCGDDIKNILFVGHNPGMHGFVHFLIAGGAPEFLEQISGNYKTGCLSVIEFDAENWTALPPGSGNLVDLMVGKELPPIG